MVFSPTLKFKRWKSFWAWQCIMQMRHGYCGRLAAYSYWHGNGDGCLALVGTLNFLYVRFLIKQLFNRTHYGDWGPTGRGYVTDLRKNRASINVWGTIKHIFWLTPLPNLKWQKSKFLPVPMVLTMSKSSNLKFIILCWVCPSEKKIL